MRESTKFARLLNQGQTFRAIGSGTGEGINALSDKRSPLAFLTPPPSTNRDASCPDNDATHFYQVSVVSHACPGASRPYRCDGGCKALRHFREPRLTMESTVARAGRRAAKTYTRLLLAIILDLRIEF
ncbi:hypothetical protein EVAR_30798_1 [Eumeta japonica]|uniref:Uncharacterized protein n=1 Tax=Eumeta variegata TaxID=151549 RepID=A0A4C1V8A1_EUMVA|nr:hypothetical protein EVAR_30798_1 [Eumeta japonica]